MNAQWQVKIVKAIIKHFHTGITSNNYVAYVEGETPQANHAAVYAEIRYTGISWKQKDNRDWEGRIIVNILCVTPDGLDLTEDRSIYEKEELMGIISNLFSSIQVEGVGCLVLENNFGEDIQVKAPRRVEGDTNISKATVTGHYVICPK